MNSGGTMLDLEALEKLIAFDTYGTLSKTSEEIHISQPTLTRTMKQVEDDFGVPLFIREKNRLTLNETGKEAVKVARELIDSAHKGIQNVQDFHQRLHTIVVESCAPAPIWRYLPEISGKYPNNTISSKILDEKEVEEDLINGKCDIGITIHQIDGMDNMEYFSEQLYVCVPLNHPMADKESVCMHELNGYNCLLRSQLGFWDRLCRDKMPSSKFLVQTIDEEFFELVKSSSLLCFSSDYFSENSEIFNSRKRIIIEDAKVTYYIVIKKART